MSDTLFEMVKSTEHGKLGLTEFVMNSDLDERTGRARNSDPATSKAGAEDVAYRAGSQKAKLLVAYDMAGERGLTDEEAAELAGLNMRSCFWKRCGELRQDGYIVETGDTRIGDAGVSRIVSRITTAGRSAAVKVVG